jgi:RNA polymerase sigma-70 factor (ECF subfamily)
MNQAIAIGYAKSYREGLNALQKISELNGNHFYHAALGNFFWRLKERDHALKSYSNALNEATTSADKDFLQKKINEIELSK